MKRLLVSLLGGGLLTALALFLWHQPAARAQSGNQLDSLDWQLPNNNWRLPFEKQRPIRFVGTADIQDWLALPKFWNEVTEEAVHPVTGEKVTRNAVKIKLPLGLAQAPAVPLENEMTVERWALGKKLYFDEILSSDNTISCASCHDPARGWTDQSIVSLGIGGQKGPVSAPTVLNSAYHARQFWDGRAASLEDQAQGPVGNPLEMFDNNGHAWNKAVLRVRDRDDYNERFKAAYGTEPTRDAIAKAIAVFERTVFSGNSVHDRADLAMKFRVAEEGGTKFELQPKDYEKVLNEAFANNDATALKALGLDPAKDQAKVPALAKSIASGRDLFFGKARCNSCHVGDNFTDNNFHNLGVGVKDGVLPPTALGRFAVEATGHKNPDMAGAFKTPTLRSLTTTAPYMHDGSEKTLMEVIEFYDKGGNANRYLDTKMRDFDAEKAYILARQGGKKYTGPKVYVMGPDQTPVVPLELKLTQQEKEDLVNFLKALEGEPLPAIISDPEAWPETASRK